MIETAILIELQHKKPLIHCISNIVTANDCANLLLAVGASPIMAQAPEEMAEISAAAQAVVLNTGTPDENKFHACIRAGQAANTHGVPVILDPVGVGASQWRLEHIRSLLDKVHPDIIRVNYGEACALLGHPTAEHGVDSIASELSRRKELASELAIALDCVVLLSGTEDVISYGVRTECTAGGSERMKQITGAGCMLSALCGAFCAVESAFDAALDASRFWKRTAERADSISRGCGLGRYHMALFDAVSMHI